MKKYFKYASLILWLLYISTSWTYAAVINWSCKNSINLWCTAWTASWMVQSWICWVTQTWVCKSTNWGTNSSTCSKANQTCTLPTLSATISPATPISGWYNSNPTITMYTADTSGSWLNYSRYRWNNSACTSSANTYSNWGSVTLSTNWTNTLYICNKDNVNLTNSGSYVYKLDKTTPTWSVTYTPSTWTNWAVTVTITCSDTWWSGCASSSYTANVISNWPSNITIYDNAWNSKNVAYNVTKIDTINPVASASATVPVSGWYSSTPSITLNTSDSWWSWLKTNYSKYSWDTDDSTCRTSWTPYTNWQVISDIPLSDWTHILYVCNEDNAWNTNYNSYSYKIDRTAPSQPTVTCDEFNNNDSNNYDWEDTCRIEDTSTISPKNKVQYSIDNGSSWSDTTWTGMDLSFKITPPPAPSTTNIKMRIRDESLLWATSDTFALIRKNGPYIPLGWFSFSPTWNVTAWAQWYIQLTFYDYLSSTYKTGDTTTDFKYTISGYDGTNFSENININNNSCPSYWNTCSYTWLATAEALVTVTMIKSSSKRIKVVIKEPISANKAWTGTYNITLENSDRWTWYNDTQTSPQITVTPDDSVWEWTPSISWDNVNWYNATISSLKDIWGNSYNDWKSFNVAILWPNDWGVKFKWEDLITKDITLSNQNLTFGFEWIWLVRWFSVWWKNILLSKPIGINTLTYQSSSVDFKYSNSSVILTTNCTNDDFSGCDPSGNNIRTFNSELQNGTTWTWTIEDMAWNTWGLWLYNMHHIDKTTPVTSLSCYSSWTLITTDNTTNKNLVTCDFWFENETKTYYSPKSLHIEVLRKNTSWGTTLTRYYSWIKFNRFYAPWSNDSNYSSFFDEKFDKKDWIDWELWYSYTHSWHNWLKYYDQTYYYYDNYSSNSSANWKKYAYKWDLLNEDFGTNWTYKINLHWSDHAGNVSTIKSLTFKVDTTRPRIDTDLDENIWYTTNPPYTQGGDTLKNFEFIIADQTWSTTDNEETWLQNLVVKLNWVDITSSEIKLWNLWTDFSLWAFRTTDTSEKKIILPRDYLKDMANNFDKVNTLRFEITDKVWHIRVKKYNLKIDRTTPNTPVISCKNWANTVDFPNGIWKNFGWATCTIAPDSTFWPSPVIVEYSIKNNWVTNTYTWSWSDTTQPFSLTQPLAEWTNILKVRVRDVAWISTNVTDKTNAPNWIYVLKIDRTPPKIKWNCNWSEMIEWEPIIDKYSSWAVSCSWQIDPVRPNESDTSPETLEYIHSTSDWILATLTQTNWKTNWSIIKSNWAWYTDNWKYTITMSWSDEAGNIAIYDVNGWSRKNMIFKIDTTTPEWISSPLNGGKNINSWYNSWSLQNISFTIKDKNWSTTWNEETWIKSIKVFVKWIDRTNMFNWFTETTWINWTTITISWSSLQWLVGASADKIKTWLNKFRFEITDKVWHTYITPDSLPTTQRPVDTNNFDMTEGIAEHHDDTIPATPTITCVNWLNDSLNWPNNIRKNYTNTKCYIAPKVNTYWPSPVKIIWEYRNNQDNYNNIIASWTVNWQNQAFASGTTSSWYVNFWTGLYEWINKIKFKVEDTAWTSTWVEYIIKKDTIAPGVWFNFSSFPKLAWTWNVDIPNQRIFDNFGWVYNWNHILNKCSDSDCWLTWTMSIRWPTYTGSFSHIFDEKSFSWKYNIWSGAIWTFRFTDNEEYSLTWAWDYKIQFDLIDKAGNETHTGWIVHIYPNFADEDMSTVSTVWRNSIYANNSWTYTYTLTLKDKFWNLIHNKKLMYLNQESGTSTGEIKTDMVTYLSGGLTTAQVSLLTDSLVEQWTWTIDETDWTWTLSTMWQTQFSIKSLAPWKFTERFKIKIYSWWSGYINNTTLRTLYITGSTTNSFRKPFWWKLQISKTNWSIVDPTDTDYADDWDWKPSIWTTRAYMLLIKTWSTLTWITLDNWSWWSLSWKIIPIGNSIISLQWTKLFPDDNIISNINTNIRNYIRFSTRINNSWSTAIDNSYNMWFSWWIITLPIVNYTLSWFTIKYNLSSNSGGNDLSSIKIWWERFLDPVIVWGTQVWAGSRVNLTWQERNSTDLTTSKMRAEIRKNVYTFIKSLTSNIVVNGVKYVYWSYSWSINGIDGWNTYETLVVRNWNLTINSDIPYINSKPIWIVVLKDLNYDPKTDFSWSTAMWNIYIDRNVTSINAVIYADWWIISSDGWVPYVKDSITRTDNLMEPLTIKWSIFSRNTIWWAILRWTTYALPWWDTIKESDTWSFDNAMIYDLNYLRRWWKCAEDASNPTILTDNWNCATGMIKKSSFKIEYDPKIQTNPPKLFYK